MFKNAFDERFEVAAAANVADGPQRVLAALFVSAVCCISGAWTAGLIWLGAILALEVPFRYFTHAVVRDGASGRRAWGCVVTYAVASMVWSLGGMILWSSDRAACHLVAIALFAGLTLYFAGQHGRSIAALTPVAPTLLAAPLAPLIWQHYQGVDQVLVEGAMLMATFAVLPGIRRNLMDAANLKAAHIAMTRALEEAESANQAKSAFLATMSHEIRTPLNGVLGMAQAIAADSKTARRVRDQVGVIRRSGEQLLAILNDILDLSRVEAGKLELEVIPFDLSDLVLGVRDTFAPIAKAKEVSLSVNFQDGAAGFYMGDPVRLRQILHNLISNALKFTEAGEIEVDLSRGDDGLQLTVSDTGIGIEAEQLSRLFGKFEQADVSTTRRYGGAGLGLSICRELATLMGGTVDAQSEPGRGSQFTVRLPIGWMGPAPVRTEPAPTLGRPIIAPGRPLRVLAAEDNNVNQLVLTILLAQVGIEPTIVSDGSAALEAWKAQPWDLVLMDIQMPVMDGATTTRAIRAAELQTGRPRTPILALTANAMPNQVAEYLSAGMDGHVAKPLDATSLYVAIERVIGHPASDAAAA